MMAPHSLRASLNAKDTRALVILMILVFQNTALVLITKCSYEERETPHVVSTVITCSEFLKLFISCAFVAFAQGKLEAVRALRELPSVGMRLSLPAVLYVFQNRLLFEGVRLMNPTVYLICLQSKVLTSALFGFVLLHKKVNGKQFMAMCMLMCGMVMAQRDSAQLHAQSKFNDSHKGFFHVILASVISGFTGAYLEKIYKEGIVDHSVWYRNAQLACFSIPVSLLSMLWYDYLKIQAGGFFQGYNNFVIVVIILQALGGLVVAAVMRYADNILKCFAVSVSVCSCMIASQLMPTSQGNTNLNGTQVIGITTVMYSTFLFVKSS